MKTLLLAACCLLLASICLAKTVNLSWDASPTPNVAGYKVYYKCNSAEPTLPFDSTDASLPSPIDVGNNLSYTVEGLADEVACYFAVTAYDAANYESSFSNIVYSQGFAAPEPPSGLNGTTTVNALEVPFLLIK